MARYLPREEDRQALAVHLLAYQRDKNTGWDVYRKRVPNPLLVGFRKILHGCMQIGFVNPEAVGTENETKIKWSQVLGYGEHIDRCTLCDYDPCYRHTDRKGDFVPCWKDHHA